MSPTEMKKGFDALPIALKIIAGLVGALFTLSLAYGNHINNRIRDMEHKLDALIEYNQSQDKQISANTTALGERSVTTKILQEDMRELRIDIKDIKNLLIKNR